MSKKTPTSDSAVMSQLTAYLDGELDSDEILEVEKRLAADENYRSILQQMQQTWDVLDILPSSAAKSTFTQSTMKLVVDDARKLTKQKRCNVWTWPLRFLTLLLIPAAMGSAAFLTGRYIQEQPNRQLANDFPVIKDLDVYNCDRNLSVEFLSALADEQGIFGSQQPVPDDKRYTSFSNPAFQFENLNKCTGLEKDLVRSNLAGFQNLSSESRQRVRALQNGIDVHDRRSVLRDTLYHYHRWLDSLTETDKTTVLDAQDDSEKIATIKSISLLDFAIHMPKEDLNSVYLALIDFVTRRYDAIEQQFLQLFSLDDDDIIQIRARSSGPSEKPLIIGGARLKKIYREHPEVIGQLITDEDLDRITTSLLSENGKFFFNNANVYSESVESEAHLLASWLVTVYDEKFSPEQEDLQDFFRSLPMDVKDALNNEHPEDRALRLLRMWEESF